jgi:hypothetical protein
MVSCDISDVRGAVQHIEGLRDRILSNGLLDSLLYYAAIGELTVHTEVKPSEVEQMGLIAEGASAKVYRAKFKGKDVALKGDLALVLLHSHFV